VRGFITALVALLITHAQAQGFRENPAYATFRGPIPIRDARPYNLLFLQFIPESADILRQRSDRYDLQLDIINNTLIPNPALGAQVVEDNEYQRLRLAWRRGLDSQTELGMFASLEWRNGGVLDGIIRAYHHLLGLPANSDDVPLGRDHYPLYESKLQVIDTSTGRAIVNQGNAFGLGETMVTLKRRLISANRRSALAMRFGLKLPTGNPTLLLGSGNIDAGLTLDGRYSLGRELILYANLGYVVMGHASRLPGARPNTVETLVALEYRPNNRDSFVAQVDGNGQFVRTGNTFADRSNVTATFGYQRVLDRHVLGFLSFSEGGHIHNFTLPGLSNIGPEFTLSVGMTWLR
jgi:hypothetical protein